ncbi:MAG: hypothetical protein K0R36_1683, partial [Chryseobacterium sp.]|nr:hypothetical protein [Chryseobacterium sp.]
MSNTSSPFGGSVFRPSQNASGVSDHH